MGISPQIMQILAGLLKNNATPQSGGGDAPSQASLFSPEQSMTMDAMHYIQEGQELQKRLKDPSLQPTFIEQLMASKIPFAATGLQLKAEQRSQLQQYQLQLAKHLMDTGNERLVPSLFRPMKDEEIGTLAQTYMQAGQQKAAIQAPYREAMTAPVEGNYTGELANVLSQYTDQGASTSFSRPPTTQEQGQRVTQGATNPATSLPMLMAMQSTLGKEAGTLAQNQLQLIQRQAEQPTPEQRIEDRKFKFDQQQGRIEERKAVQQRHEDTLNNSKERTKIASEQLEAAKENREISKEKLKLLQDKHTLAQRQQEAAQKSRDNFMNPDAAPGKQSSGSTPAILQRAAAMKLDIPLATAIYGNEGSGDNSVSPKGALGRGQIMPATAYSEYGVTEDKLKDPDINATTSLRYMSDLSLPGGKYYKKTLGKPEAVLAAYFSGPGNVENGEVKDWTLHDGTKEKPGTTVRQYVDSGMKRYRQAQAQGVSGAQAGTAAPQDAMEANAGLAVPTQPQGPTLDPYTRPNQAGTTETGTGRISTNYPQARQQSAELYIEKALQKSPSLIPQAIAEAIKHGDSPGTEAKKEYVRLYSNAAYLRALSDPSVTKLPEGKQFDAAIKLAATYDPMFNPETVKGYGDTSAKAGATERIKSAQGEVGKAEGRTEVTKTPAITLFNAFDKDERYKNFYDTKTGAPLDPSTPITEATSRLGKTAHEMTTQESEKYNKYREAAVAIEPLFRNYEKLYGPSGVYHKYTASKRFFGAPMSFLAYATQSDPTLVAAFRETGQAAVAIARQSGQTGAFSDLDMQEARDNLVKLVGFADTPEVADRLIKDINQAMNSKMALLLNNPKHNSPSIYRPLIPLPRK